MQHIIKITSVILFFVVLSACALTPLGVQEPIESTQTAIVAQDFVDALEKLPGYEPKTTTVQLKASTVRFALSLEQALKTAGYGLQLIPNDETGPFIVSHESQTYENTFGSSVGYRVRVGAVELAREYEIREGRVVPMTGMSVRGVQISNQPLVPTTPLPSDSDAPSKTAIVSAASRSATLPNVENAQEKIPPKKKESTQNPVTAKSAADDNKKRLSSESPPRLVIVSTDGDGFFLFNSKRQWVNNECVSQLRKDGITLESVSWNIVKLQPKASKSLSCSRVQKLLSDGKNMEKDESSVARTAPTAPLPSDSNAPSKTVIVSTASRPAAQPIVEKAQIKIPPMKKESTQNSAKAKSAADDNKYRLSSESSPKLVIVSTDGDGFFLFNNKRQWVNNKCVSQLTKDGITLESVSWNIVKLLPKASKSLSCSKVQNHLSDVKKVEKGEPLVAKAAPTRPTKPPVSPKKFNVLELGRSNFAEALTDYQTVRELTMIFPFDSMRMGNENRSGLRFVAKQFDPETDVISVLGCSQGHSRIKNGNELLATGRANRVKEQLVMENVPASKILEEGCWSPEPQSDRPNRAVIVTHRRLSGAS